MDERQRMELRVIEIVEGGIGEHAFVEFKERVPSDPRRAARRIAGLSNVANGAEAVWLIGVSDVGQVVGTERVELASWWPQITRFFDDPPPDLTEIYVSHPDGLILGLFFRTDRVPYVVKTDRQDPDREVPWRDGTAIRSARRSELYRALAPHVQLPRIELLTNYVSLVQTDNRADPDRWVLNARLTFFVETTQPIVFPAHRQRLSLSFPHQLSAGIELNCHILGSDVETSSGVARIGRACVAELRGNQAIYSSHQAGLIGSEPVTKVRAELHVSSGKRPIVLHSQAFYSKELHESRSSPISEQHYWESVQ